MYNVQSMEERLNKYFLNVIKYNLEQGTHGIIRILPFTVLVNINQVNESSE